MKISAVIPALSEQETLGQTLDAVRRQSAPFEIIICDGGSVDDSVEIARASAGKVVMSERGRGQQLRAGIAEATGDVILMLHADTTLGPGAFDALRKALQTDSICGGNFEVVFDGETRFARWLTGYYQWLRSNGFYYGDSGIFVRRAVHDRIGGIRAMALMEDYDFVCRLEAHGETICIAKPPIITSSRRFSGRRPWRIYTQWLWLHTLYYLRVPPGYLARSYRSADHAPARVE